MNSSASSYYFTGGTLPGTVPSYVERQADQDLLSALLAGEFCYVLDTRQVGKSSLMVRTAERLRSSGVQAAILDVSAIGDNMTLDQWYYGLLNSLATPLNLEVEADKFWLSQTSFGAAQRWFMALTNIILPQIDARLVVFVDEIDAVRKLPFSVDEFFGMIRESHNRRAYDPVVGRITFCLMGVATPSDLIQDARTTPFNIGKRIELRDFTKVEMQSLTQGLFGDDAEKQSQLNQVYFWTGGHPYLTQKLCQAVAREGKPLHSAEIDAVCQRIFLRKQAQEEDDNLKFVGKQILHNQGELAAILTLFDSIRSRKKYVVSDSSDPVLSRLLLSGVVTSVGGTDAQTFGIRNRIYATVFDKKWVVANMPDAELRRQRAAVRRGFLRASFAYGTFAALVAIAVYLGNLAYSATTKAQIANLAQKQAEVEKKVANAENLKSIQSKQEMSRSLDASKSEKRTLQQDIGKVTKQLKGYNERIKTEKTKLTALETRYASVAKDIELAKGLSASAYSLMSGNEWKAVQSGQEAVAPLLAIGKQPSRNAIQGLVDAISTGIMRKARLVHPGGVVYASFNRTGTKAITVGHSRFAYIWDAYTGKVVQKIEVLPLKANYQVVTYAAFSDDEKWIVTVSDEGGICIWNAEDRSPVIKKPLFVLPERAAHDNTAVLSSDSNYSTRNPKLKTYLISTGRENSALIWDLPKDLDVKKMIPIRLKGHVKYLWGVDISLRGKWAATASEDGTAKVWDATTGALANTYVSKEGPVYSVKINLDENHIALSGKDKIAKLWHWSDNRIAKEYPGHFATVRDIFISAKDDYLTTVGDDSLVHVWSFRPSPYPIFELNTHTATVWSARFSSDSRRLITASNDHTSEIWKFTLPTYASMQGEILSTRFSKEGDYILCTTASNYIEIWRWRDNWHSGHIDANRGISKGAVFLKGTEQVVTASDNGELNFWDTKLLGKHSNHVNPTAPLFAIRAHRGKINSLNVSSDGKTLLTAGADYTAKMFLVSTGKNIGTFAGHEGEFHSAAFSNDDSRVVTTSADGAVRVWDAHTTEILQKFTLPSRAPDVDNSKTTYPVNAVFSPDGKYVVSADTNQNGYVWEIASGKLKAVLKGHSGALTSVAISPDGKLIATTSQDRTVCVWQMSDIAASSIITPLYVLRHFKSAVQCVAFSPDGLWLTAAGDDGIGHVYPATLNGMVEKAKEILQDKPIEGHAE